MFFLKVILIGGNVHFVFASVLLFFNFQSVITFDEKETVSLAQCPACRTWGLSCTKLELHFYVH